MPQSEQINELAAALCKLQSALKPALKDSTNPFFRSKYADLNAVWDSCRDLLGNNGLSVVQTVDWQEAASGLKTTLLHNSGQWISGIQRLNPVKDDPQGIGSSITYARRYGLSAILGIVSDDDDDGNVASGKKEEKKVMKIEPANDLEKIREQAQKLGSNGARQILAARMREGGKYTKEQILYATGY